MANTENYMEQGGAEWVIGASGTLKTSTGQSLKKHIVTIDIADISTAGEFVAYSPMAGTISKITSCINGAIATADAVLTCKIEGTGITTGVITVANAASAIGDIDSVTPTALNVVAAGEYISVATSGASTNTVQCAVTFEIDLS